MSMSSIDSPRTRGGDATLWQRLRELAEAETGMDFSGSRLSRLRDAAAKVLAAENPPGHLEQILAHPHRQGPFLDRLTAELTVGETFFFRNEHHFRALAEDVIPLVLRENDANREIRIWAAGCSTGEEPYSVAILLDKLLADKPQWRVSILATDLNPEFLERARLGHYRKWSFRGTDIQQDRTYFARQGEEYWLTSRIREHVRFSYLNLVKDVYPSPLNGTLGIDLIVFRNVAIYLKPEIVDAIVERFHRALRPGGWLLLGETELNVAATRQFEVHRFDQAVFYRKKLDVTASGKPPSPAATAPMLATLPPPVFAATRQPPAAPTSSIPTRGALKLSKEAPAAAGERVAALSLPERIDHRLSRQELAKAERSIDAVPGRKERAEARLRCALHLVGCANIQRARDMLEKCLKDEPLLIEAHLLKASLAEEAGDLDEAERDYRRALYVDRRCAIAHFHLALVQQERGDIRGARRSMQTVLELTRNSDPNGLVEHSDGVCYGRLREMAEMIPGL